MKDNYDPEAWEHWPRLVLVPPPGPESQTEQPSSFKWVTVGYRMGPAGLQWFEEEQP
jgi:hypothetical protein